MTWNRALWPWLFPSCAAGARVPRDLRSLRRACEYVHAHFGENLTLAQVARAAGVHPVYLGQIFRQEFGETLGEYLNRIRVRAAAERLANSDLPLSAIALDFGFYDQSHFTRIFRQVTGATPGVFRADYARAQKFGPNVALGPGDGRSAIAG